MKTINLLREILKMHLISLGINHAQEVLLIADGETSPVRAASPLGRRQVSFLQELALPLGAEWIWKHIPPLLESLGLTNEMVTAVFVLQ